MRKTAVYAIAAVLLRRLISTFVFLCVHVNNTVMTLIFRTDRSGQTVQTQIRLLLEEQSDQDLHCLLFHLHYFDKISFKVWPLCLNFR